MELQPAPGISLSWLLPKKKSLTVIALMTPLAQASSSQNQTPEGESDTQGTCLPVSCP